MGVIVSTLLLNARYGTERDEMRNGKSYTECVNKIPSWPSSALGLKGWRLFNRLGGSDVHCVRDVGFNWLERHPIAISNLLRGIVARPAVSALGRAVFYDRLVLPFGDLDRVHLVLRADLMKSEAIFGMPFRGVIPPRTEKKEVECQRRAKRTSEKWEKQ